MAAEHQAPVPGRPDPSTFDRLRVPASQELADETGEKAMERWRKGAVAYGDALAAE